MKGSEILKLAEDGKIERGRLIIDKDGNEFVFTGKMFQPYLYKDEVIDLLQNENIILGFSIYDNWVLGDMVKPESE